MQFHAVERLDELVARAALTLGEDDDLALSYLDRSAHKCRIGDFESAARYWSQFDALPRPANRGQYRIGYGEYHLARLQLFKGAVDEDLLLKIDQLAATANSRFVIRAMSWLRGEWHLSSGEWAKAASFFEENVKLTREVNMDSLTRKPALRWLSLNSASLIPSANWQSESPASQIPPMKRSRNCISPWVNAKRPANLYKWDISKPGTAVRLTFVGGQSSTAARFFRGAGRFGAALGRSIRTQSGAFSGSKEDSWLTSKEKSRRNARPTAAPAGPSCDTVGLWCPTFCARHRIANHDSRPSEFRHRRFAYEALLFLLFHASPKSRTDAYSPVPFSDEDLCLTLLAPST